jgi:hypothetical protein
MSDGPTLFAAVAALEPVTVRFECFKGMQSDLVQAFDAVLNCPSNDSSLAAALSL